MTIKNLVKLGENQIAGSPAPAKSPEHCVIDAGILGYGEVGTKG